MNLIFCDVDGVLSTRPGSLDADKLERLKELCDKTNAKVVISSSWREHPHMLERLLGAFREYRIPVVGQTPILQDPILGWGFVHRRPRREEIQAFLRSQIWEIRYVILDDDHGANNDSEGWIWIDPAAGLQDIHVTRASKYLNQ